MISQEIKKSNEIIAKFIGFEQSELEPDYWWCNELGLTSLKFHEDWTWLMNAIIKVQQTHEYALQEKPYNVKEESFLLSNFLSKL
jgi:hypothetical protein